MKHLEKKCFCTSSSTDLNGGNHAILQHFSWMVFDVAQEVHTYLIAWLDPSFESFEHHLSFYFKDYVLHSNYCFWLKYARRKVDGLKKRFKIQY